MNISSVAHIYLDKKLDIPKGGKIASDDLNLI